jgi:hypothetical protein
MLLLMEVIGGVRLDSVANAGDARNAIVIVLVA